MLGRILKMHQNIFDYVMTVRTSQTGLLRSSLGSTQTQINLRLNYKFSVLFSQSCKKLSIRNKCTEDECKLNDIHACIYRHPQPSLRSLNSLQLHIPYYSTCILYDVISLDYYNSTVFKNCLHSSISSTLVS